jgi:hypothetical protein
LLPSFHVESALHGHEVTPVYFQVVPQGYTGKHFVKPAPHPDRALVPF